MQCGAPNAAVHVGSGATFTTPELTILPRSPVASYYALVMNEAGLVQSAAATLRKVTCASPTITRQPLSDADEASGSRVLLSADAVGDGPLAYQWYVSDARGGAWKPVDGGTWNALSVDASTAAFTAPSAVGEGVATDLSAALVLFERAAAKNHDGALFNLGNLYREGRGVSKDEQRAAALYERAAKLGHRGAAYNLAWMYENGTGIGQDSAHAARWYRVAADLGDPESQGRYGYMLAEGIGVKRNAAEAVSWLKRAAEAGDAEAQFNFAVMLENGDGTPENKELAQLWYRIAADNGHEAAAKALQEP